MKQLWFLILLLLFVNLANADSESNNSGKNLNGDLTVTITNLDNTKGQILIGLFNSSSTFPINGQEYRGQKIIPITNLTQSTTFSNLAPGIYAIAVIHDTDLTGTLTKNIFGIPLEQYGFSNNVTHKSGQLTFEEAKFTHSTNKQIIQIQLN